MRRPLPCLFGSSRGSAPARVPASTRVRAGFGVAAAWVCLAGLAATPVWAQAKPGPGWAVGMVLDVGASSRALALGQRDQGLALGHSDVSARGPLGRHFSAQLGAAVHQHEGRVEAELEEAWVQTRSLPGGLQARAGRFASQIGYLNEQHPHADDFVERPLLYRAFLGGHWFDDGLRLNWTAPLPVYLNLGAEVFRGKQLVREAASARAPGAFTLSAKAGGDWGAAQSWQAGLAYVKNRREAAVEAEAHHDDPADEDDDEDADGHAHAHHHHAHGALFSGRQLWLADLAWKWSPDGNNRQQQLKLVAEAARVSGINRYAGSGQTHSAQALSALWRWRPDWEAGARLDWLQVQQPHGDHFHAARLREQAVVLAWKPTHAQALRLQLTRQQGGAGLESEQPVARRSLQLQYVLSFGAHGAHAF